MDMSVQQKTPQYAVADVFRTHAAAMSDTLHDIVARLNRIQSHLDRICEETERPERYLLTLQQLVRDNAPKTLWRLAIHRTDTPEPVEILGGLMLAMPVKDDPSRFGWYPKRGQMLDFGANTLRDNLTTIWGMVKDETGKNTIHSPVTLRPSIF